MLISLAKFCSMFMLSVTILSPRALMKESTSLYNLFTRLNNTFSKDSSDCISTLSTALELLRRLLIEPELQQQQNTSTDCTAAGTQAMAERNSTTQAAVSASELAQVTLLCSVESCLLDNARQYEMRMLKFHNLYLYYQFVDAIIEQFVSLI